MLMLQWLKWSWWKIKHVMQYFPLTCTEVNIFSYVPPETVILNPVSSSMKIILTDEVKKPTSSKNTDTRDGPVQWEYSKSTSVTVPTVTSHHYTVNRGTSVMHKSEEESHQHHFLYWCWSAAVWCHIKHKQQDELRWSTGTDTQEVWDDVFFILTTGGRHRGHRATDQVQTCSTFSSPTFKSRTNKEEFIHCSNREQVQKSSTVTNWTFSSNKLSKTLTVKDTSWFKQVKVELSLIFMSWQLLHPQ